MAYYRVLDDVEYPGRWFLGYPRSPSKERVLPWRFVGHGRVNYEDTLEIPVLKPGMAMDFTDVGFGAPVISLRVKEAILDLVSGSVQVIPVHVVGATTPYYILNLLAVIECVDERHSTYKLFTDNDPVRPDLAGKFRIIEKLVIDEGGVGKALLFRVARSEMDIVAHESVKAAFEAIGATGARFVPLGLGPLDPAFWVRDNARAGCGGEGDSEA